MKKLLFLLLIPFFFVACDKEKEDNDGIILSDPHYHTFDCWFNSKDGNARVQFRDYFPWTNVFIPAEGGTFSFTISDESRFCQSGFECELHDQKLSENFKIRLLTYYEDVWKCKIIPVNPTCEEMMTYKDEKGTVEKYIKNPEDKYIETEFGGFVSEENGFTIHVRPNEGDKERSYVLVFEPYFDIDNFPVVCIIQACSN